MYYIIWWPTGTKALQMAKYSANMNDANGKPHKHTQKKKLQKMCWNHRKQKQKPTINKTNAATTGDGSK